MLVHSTANGVSHWKSPDGELRIWKPAPHVLMTRFEGKYFDFDFATHVMRAIDEIASAVEKPDIVHDWWLMESYATESRSEMTSQAVRLMPKVRSFAVLSRSKLVQMGISMANLMMNGRLQMLRTPAELDAFVAECVSRRS